MSKTIFFLVPYPKGEAPSQRFRFEQYLTAYEDAGYTIEIHPFYDYSTWQTLYSEGNQIKKAIGVLFCFFKRFGLLFKLRRANYIFVHREVAHVGPPIFEWIISKVLRRKYIYDFDDAIWLPNYSETNARFHRLKAYWKVNYCMKWAYKVIAGNEYLASHAKQYNQHVEVIPTTIDTENHHTILCDHEKEEIVIGWTGTHTTMHYLDELVPVLRELESSYTFTFLVISNEAPLYNLNSLEFIKWNKETEIKDLARINIGVMPLQHDIWSEGKCGFKGLQYMALEMATIMSPVGVNTSIVHDGVNGFLAGNQKEWKEKLTLLIENKDLRLRLGQAGKQTIEEHFSVNSNKNKYLQIFKS